MNKPMFKLMVSHDCGTTYREEQTAERIDLLDNRCKELDEQGWRWTIQDKKAKSFVLARFTWTSLLL